MDRSGGARSSSANGTKSKQERIRDNQRRSRARRKEHVVDLERRLAECHTTCREAELQREAFRELQHENCRLRELLAQAGFTSAAVDAYVTNATRSSKGLASGARVLKPKFASPQPPFWTLCAAAPDTPTTSTASPGCSSGGCQSGVAQSTSTRGPSRLGNQIAPFQSLTGVDIGSGDDEIDSASDAEHDSASTRSFLAADDNERPSRGDDDESKSFVCDTFHVPATGALLQYPEDTSLCSVANDILNRFGVNGREMDEIKARLSAGFCRPAMPGQGCRVSNQLLLEVLNSIRSRSSDH